MGVQKRNEERLTALFSQMQEELSNASKADEYQAFAIERQQERARKKAVFTKNAATLETNAIERFISVNEKVSSVAITLEQNVISDSRHFIQSVLENYTTSVREHNVQVSLDFMHLFELWKFGPGASIGTKSTHPAEKMYESWSCTPAALDLVLQLRRNNPYLYLHDLRSDDINCRLVQGSKLATVPKNEERNRTIAIEPLGNMCLQLAAGKYLEGALRRIGLNISDQQPKNKEAAREGSMNQRLSTIDLSDASDMFSPELVRLLFPDEWYKLFMKIRSPNTTLPNGQVVHLGMISTMGNGFTFPMMTLTLLALVYGTMCALNCTRSLYINWDNVYIFGDDIIIPTDIFEDVCSVIRDAGLIVNTDKSFSKGPFRESCGGDFWKGVDVTPFYVKTLHDNPDVYVVVNQILEWTAKSRTSLPKTLDLAMSYIDGPIFLVPEWSNPDAGIRTTLVSQRYKELRPRPKRVKFKNDEFAMPLAVGGFLVPDKLDLFYTPRLNKTRYLVKKLRLPNGYLSGRDPLTRSLPVSHHIDLELIIRGFGHFG